jgi:hypothetical protein
MTHYILYVSPSSARETASWQADLPSRGVVSLRAATVGEALQYCRAYDLLAVFLELGALDHAARQDVCAIASSFPDKPRPPLLGVCTDHPSDAERLELAMAGLDDLILKADPDRFILWRLETLVTLSNLRRFEKARIDVAELAGRTRAHLHELSQPLSAVQGRLQLLAARCPADDPNAQTFQELVRLIFEVTQQVMQIQQVHRQFS